MKKLLYITSIFNLSYNPIGQRIAECDKYFKSKSSVVFVGNKSIDKVSKIICRCHFFEKLFHFIGKISEVFSIESLTIKLKLILYASKYRQKFDIVYIQTRPFSFTGLIGLVRKLFPSAKICMEMTDPLSINVKFHQYPKFRQHQLLQYEKKLKNLDCLIVLNEEIKKYYSSYVPNGQVLVVEQGVSDKLIESLSTIYSKEDYEEIRLIYAGSFYQGIREPFELYKAVEESSNSKLDVFGNFNAEFVINNNAISCHGIISPEQLYRRYQIYDWIVYIDNDSAYQVPGKLYEILSSQKAILFISNNINSPSYKIASKYEGVYFVKNNSQEIESVLEKVRPSQKYLRDPHEFCWSTLLNKLNFLFVDDSDSILPNYY